MRILVLGAGGTGGYFGGRLSQSGADITFLVRPARAAQLKSRGLQLRSQWGDADLRVKTVQSETLTSVAGERPFDLILLSCKAYDLTSSLGAIAPAMAAHTMVLPILNGLLHYAELDNCFGSDRVLGGLCFINAAKGYEGEILHLGRHASITFGDRQPIAQSWHVTQFARLCTSAGLDYLATPDINQELWDKFTFITTLAAGTCLMRASVGQIVAAEGGTEFIQALYSECLAVARLSGREIAEQSQAKALATLTEPASVVKASMLRDLEAGQEIEGGHIVGDMLHRAMALDLDAPLLAAAWGHLQAYQSTRNS